MREIRKVVIVGGCGHVGLPFGLVLADRADVEVYLLDVDQGKTDLVNLKQAPFMETGLESLMQQHIGKRVVATTDKSCIRDADAVITVVGTPVDVHLNPTVTDLKRNVDEVIKYMSDGALLVLRSTVYPGVTELVYDQIKSTGRNILLSFCPERIAEGRALEELVKLPQIISAFDSEALEMARRLFSLITDKIIELSPMEAELAKLFTNSWRYLNFAISNQFYMIAEGCGLDFYKIYSAITSDYPRMKSFARAGLAAGPCLLKDTLQLSAFANNNYFLGHSAMLVNEGLPDFIVKQLDKHNIKQMTVGILGMAFKGNSDDVRDSLAFKLRKLLSTRAQRVLFTDPYVQHPSLSQLEYVVDESDVLILAAPHDDYKNLQIPKHKIVVDCWGFWPESNLDDADKRSSMMVGSA